MGTKKIIISEIETEEDIVTNFDINGFTDFEAIGILSYYLDALKVNMMSKSQSQNKKENETSN